MNKWYLAAGLAIGAGLLTTTAPAQTINEMIPEKKDVCAEADQRYKDLYPGAKGNGAVIIKTYKYTFCPLRVTVKPGTKVRWVNVDKRTSHSVWLQESGVAESERFFPEENFEYSFKSSGTFPYLCGPHGKDDNMIGEIKVKP